MFERINILKIIVNHLNTLRNIGDDTEKSSISKEDICLFFIIPLFLAVFLTYKNVSLDSQVANLIAIISIFGGFLFNLLALIYGLLDKIKEKSDSPVKKKFAIEINSNISFNILLSLVTTIFLVLYNLIPTSCSLVLICFKSGLLLIIYFLIFLFLLTLLMVLNRIYILLEIESK